ncbi:MAG: glycosyltransferase [Saprospiraceae bacterium]|nr:glycosyltransferase [Candidatus Brachybacter algidus]MBL0118409.1 glycosyltransferase [Candidatus Brachybacter algidus]
MIYWLILFAFLVASLYALFFFYATIEWLKTRELFVLTKYHPVKFSIIIPFRNEAINLVKCIESILEQHYDRDRFEIICVNDHSSDGGEFLLQTYEKEYEFIKLIQNIGWGKKQAIEAGIDISRHNHIITVDADTLRNKSWLVAMASMFNYKGIRVVAGGILMIPIKPKPFHFFQTMDYCGSIALSIVAMRKNWFRNGSGGNLAFTKDVYYRYKESNSDEGIASGDDVFLLHHAFKEDPKSVLFPKSKDLLAFTGTEPNWNSFIQQRSRWAGKTFQYKEKTMMFIWALIWIANILIPFVLIGALTGSDIMIQLLCFMIMTKFMADFIFLRTVTNYFDKSFFKYFFIAELYHVSYVIIVGINAILGIKFTWKGDKLKR